MVRRPRRGRHAMRAKAVASVLALAAGCSSPHRDATTSSATTAASSPAPASTAPSTTAASTDPAGAFSDALSERLGPNGEVDVALALDLFATAFGRAGELGATPLPGGTAEGSFAVRAVTQHWSELTPAQQAVVNAELQAPADRMDTVTPASVATTTSGPTTTEGGGPARSPFGVTDPLMDTADEVAGEIAADWGSPLGVPIQIARMRRDLPAAPGADVLATAWATDGSRHIALTVAQYRACFIEVYPAFFRLGPVDQRATLAHEVFHCFQDTVTSAAEREGFKADQPWVFEGQAEWAGATIGGGGSTAANWFRHWMNDPQELWKRDYDAIGFYAAMANHGIDPWARFRAMLATPSTDVTGMFGAAVGSAGSGFLGQVSIDHAGLADVGTLWEPTGPGAPRDFRIVRPTALASSATESTGDSIRGYDTVRFAYSVADPVVTVSSDVGPWSIGNDTTAQVVPTAGEQVLCFLDPCACPDGATLSVQHINGGRVIGIGVANPTQTTRDVNITVSGETIEQACATQPHVTVATAPCAVGSWRLTNQEFSGEALPGIRFIDQHGGIGGRTLVIQDDLTYSQTDDGSDPTTGHATVGGVAVAVSVTLVGRVAGQVTFTDGGADFTPRVVDIQMHLTETVSGAPPINVDQHLTDASLFGSGHADVTCGGGRLVLAFPNVTFTYAAA